MTLKSKIILYLRIGAPRYSRDRRLLPIRDHRLLPFFVLPLEIILVDTHMKHIAYLY